MDKTAAISLDSWPKPAGGASSILSRRGHDDPSSKEVKRQMLNPLAIGVTVGGLLLDVLVPRPKPRVGGFGEPSLLSTPSGSRTPRRSWAEAEHDGPPVASGYN